jgi:hypothetical protein
MTLPYLFGEVARRVSLDDIGPEVWRAMDGRHLNRGMEEQARVILGRIQENAGFQPVNGLEQICFDTTRESDGIGMSDGYKIIGRLVAGHGIFSIRELWSIFGVGIAGMRPRTAMGRPRAANLLKPGRIMGLAISDIMGLTSARLRSGK